MKLITLTYKQRPEIKRIREFQSAVDGTLMQHGFTKISELTYLCNIPTVNIETAVTAIKNLLISKYCLGNIYYTATLKSKVCNK